MEPRFRAGAGEGTVPSGRDERIERLIAMCRVWTAAHLFPVRQARLAKGLEIAPLVLDPLERLLLDCHDARIGPSDEEVPDHLPGLITPSRRGEDRRLGKIEHRQVHRALNRPRDRRQSVVMVADG